MVNYGHSGRLSTFGVELGSASLLAHVVMTTVSFSLGLCLSKTAKTRTTRSTKKPLKSDKQKKVVIFDI